MKLWRVGLVGAGYWSDKHLKAWDRIPNAEVTALCDLSMEKLLAKAKQFDIPVEHLYTNLETMLDTEDLDIVDVVTRPETHVDFIRKISAHRKHIMCQKPFARSVAEAEEMVEIAKRAGVRLMVAENWRWLEPFQNIHRILQSGELGRLFVGRYIHSDYFTPRMMPDVFLSQPFLRSMPQLLFYEMGSHWFDTWRFLFGTPNRLYAETIKISPYVKGEDSGIVLLGHEGFHGVLDMSWATRRAVVDKLPKEVDPHNVEELIIEGESATLKLYQDGHISLIYGGGPEEIFYPKTTYDHEESHFRLQSHFISCVDSGEEFQTSGEQNVTTLRMIFGTYESAREHKVITI